jgi:hypothetical protein
VPVQQIPPEVRGRYECRGMAAVTFEKLHIGPTKGLIAKWADLGGRWYAESRNIWVNDDVLLLEDEVAESTTRFYIRRSGKHGFLVEERYRLSFDANDDVERHEWIESDEPGLERGYRAFLKVDLRAFWTKALNDLQDAAARDRVLETLAKGTVYVEYPGEGDDEDELLVGRGMLLEGFEYVEPSALLDAALRAGVGLRGIASRHWSAVMDGTPIEDLPKSINANLVSRLRSARRE